jgi:O-antigen/teichoic acid export membrane protein
VSKNPLLQALALITQTYGVVILGVVIGIFSARALSVGDRGTLAIMLLITQLCSRLGSIGFEQLIQRNGYTDRRNSFYLAGLLGSLLTLPVAFFGAWTAHLPLPVAVVFVFLAGFIAILRVSSAFFIFKEKIRVLGLFNFGQAIFQIILYASVARFGRFWDFFAAWSLNVVIFSCISVFVSSMYDDSDSNTARSVSIKSVVSIWKEGMNYLSVVLPEMLILFCLELPLVRYVLGETKSGLYSISNTLTGIFYQVFVSLSSILIKRKDAFPKIIMFSILSILCVALLLISRPVITLFFGIRYADASKYAWIMLPVSFLMGVSRLEQVMSLNQIKGNTQIILAIGLVGSIFAGFLISEPSVVYWVALCYSLYAIVTITILSGSPKTKEGVE